MVLFIQNSLAESDLMVGAAGKVIRTPLNLAGLLKVSTMFYTQSKIMTMYPSQLV